MTKYIPTIGPVPVNLNSVLSVCVTRLKSTTRTSWMANNAIPDSIIMSRICRSLEHPVELDVPSRSSEIDAKNTLRILNTIKPVIRAFTAMDVAKPVRTNGDPQRTLAVDKLSTNTPIGASQVAIDDKLRSA
jgi:hypothetical protein